MFSRLTEPCTPRLIPEAFHRLHGEPYAPRALPSALSQPRKHSALSASVGCRFQVSHKGSAFCVWTLCPSMASVMHTQAPRLVRPLSPGPGGAPSRTHGFAVRSLVSMPELSPFLSQMLLLQKLLRRLLSGRALTHLGDTPRSRAAGPYWSPCNSCRDSVSQSHPKARGKLSLFHWPHQYLSFAHLFIKTIQVGYEAVSTSYLTAKQDKNLALRPSTRKGRRLSECSYPQAGT